VEEVQQGDPRALVGVLFPREILRSSSAIPRLDRRLGRAENLPGRFCPKTRLASVRPRNMPSKSAASTTVALVVAALYLATATIVTVRWLDVGENDVRSINHFFACRFVDMVDGRAYRPFVTRALVPGTIRVLRDTLPLRWQTAAQGAVVRTLHLRRRMAALGWEPEHAFEYVVFGVITLVLFVSIPFSVRAAFRALFAGDEFWAHLVPLPLLSIPLFADISSMYDPATLALAALAMWAAVARRKSWFYAVYALAVLNKETAFLFAALFLVTRSNDWRKHVAPLAGMWLVARLWLAWAYRDNPGSAAWWIPTRNIARALADPWGVAALCLALAVVVWSVWQWRSIRVIRLGVPLLVGVLLVAYMTVGVWGVYRIFLEALPLVWVTVYAAIMLRVGLVIAPRARDAPCRARSRETSETV
jgi:hypothetical protein